MKHPKPDIGDLLRQEFITNASTIRKLLRYWDTEVINDVSVLTQRTYYYPKNWTPKKEKLFRFLGVYDDIVGTQMQGVASAWIYFNKSKEDTTIFNTDVEEFVLHNLGLVWWDPADGIRPEGLTLTTSIVIEGEFQSNTSGSKTAGVSTTSYLDPSWSTAQLITAINTNYEAIWDTCLISQQGVGVINKGSITDPVTNIVTPDEDDLSQNDPWLQTVARYALRTNGIPCSIKDVEVGLARVESSRIYPTYIVTLEIPFIAFTAGMGIVNDIIADFSQSNYSSVTRNKLTYPNGYYTRQAIRKLSSDDLEVDDSVVTRPYMPWEWAASGGYEALWYKLGGTSVTIGGKTYTRSARYFLRADVLQHPHNYGLTFKELNQYLLPLLDSGYQKEKVSWWKKLVAIVVFVIAVVVTYVTGGSGSPALALAKALLVGVLVITALSAVLAKMGATDWAMAFAEVNKMVEPLAWVATIVLVVTGISAAIEAAKKAAAEAAAKEVADVTVKEIIKQLLTSTSEGMIENILTGAKDIFTGNVTSASLDFLGSIMKLFNTVQKMKLESINDRNRDLASEYEQLLADSELESDVLKGFAKVYASPATADWSMYTNLFDVPYEGTGGPLHTGNCQRTTKQALRKAKYDDYVFNDILII